jgi:hypothetical protein
MQPSNKISTARLGILCLGFLGCLKSGNASGAKGRHEVHHEGSMDPPLSLLAWLSGRAEGKEWSGIVAQFLAPLTNHWIEWMGYLCLV